MTSPRSGDMYLLDMPATIRLHLCIILVKEKVWKELALQMGYDLTAIEEMLWAAKKKQILVTEELLIRWSDLNHTIMELFFLLTRMRQYQAMEEIKSLVDERFHKLILKPQITNGETLTETSSRTKVLNGPSIDNKHSLCEELYETRHLNNNEETDGNEFDLKEWASTIPKIDYAELRRATRNWHEDHVLGKGGFGIVFRGMWRSTAVAIKRIRNGGGVETKIYKIQIQQSLNELRYLHSCRHDNILPLYGYSINENEPCLVYQLMQGGSLEQRLFKRPSNVPALTWRQRVVVAIGTARGLQFLHTFEDNKKPLIHGDIKPANLLLDISNQPKIGDFGMAREGTFGDESVEVSKVCGTRSYLPEEFILHRILSVKVDSYSFGIVLFQLATGLRAVKKQSYMRLADYIQKRTEQEYVHPTIPPKTQTTIEKSKLIKFVRLPLLQNVSTLTVLLVCVIAEYAHAVPYQWGWENFQQRSKRSANYKVSVVENWPSVCEEVCGAGYGGPGCGDCVNFPTFLDSQKSQKTVNLLQHKQMCPILCSNNLGSLNCKCPVIYSHNFAERNHDLLCTSACTFTSSHLRGCTRCVNEPIHTTSHLQITDDENGGGASSSEEDTEAKSSTEDSEELTEDTTTDTSTISTTESTTTSTTTTTTVQPTTTTTTTTQPTTPDWNQLCETLCRNGEGGSLCNCDIPPFL